MDIVKDRILYSWSHAVRILSALCEIKAENKRALTWVAEAIGRTRITQNMSLVLRNVLSFCARRTALSGRLIAQRQAIR